MRIHDGDGNKLTEVYLALTDDEANDLIAYLRTLLETRQKGWHGHIEDVQMISEREGRVEHEVIVYRVDDDEMVF
jgi:hypothetical protein